MENYGLTKETIETITEKAEKIMSAYDSYKLNARRVGKLRKAPCICHGWRLLRQQPQKDI